MDAAEGLLVGDVVHEDEAHGAAVVGRGDGPVPLLARRVPNLKLHPLILSEDSFDLEVYSDGADEGGGEGVVCVSEEEGGFADGAVADDEELEHVVEVLVGGILLPGLPSAGHPAALPWSWSATPG